jgi:spermidine synthase
MHLEKRKVDTTLGNLQIWDAVSSHLQVSPPKRFVFIDDVLQGGSAYHEALVHPAMFVHALPRRIAVIGSGHAATIREVLKHNTVTKVVLLESDASLVNETRYLLPEWNDCSNLVESADSCLDDTRTELLIVDPVLWFVKNFRRRENVDPKMQFDVIIVSDRYVIL